MSSDLVAIVNRTDSVEHPLCTSLLLRPTSTLYRTNTLSCAMPLGERVDYGDAKYVGIAVNGFGGLDIAQGLQVCPSKLRALLCSSPPDLSHIGT